MEKHQSCSQEVFTLDTLPANDTKWRKGCVHDRKTVRSSVLSLCRSRATKFARQWAWGETTTVRHMSRQVIPGASGCREGCRRRGASGTDQRFHWSIALRHTCGPARRRAWADVLLGRTHGRYLRATSFDAYHCSSACGIALRGLSKAR